MTASNEAQDGPRTPVEVTPDEVKVDLPAQDPQPTGRHGQDAAHPDEDKTDDTDDSPAVQ